MRMLNKAAARCVLCLFAAAFSLAPVCAADDGRNPGKSLQELREGNARFVRGSAVHPRQDGGRRQQTEKSGQSPKALVLACSDSRVPVEVLFDQGVGDIFVVRVAGNVPGVGVLGTIEYAVEHLGVPLIVVMGHTHCGAVDSVWAGGKHPANLSGLLHPLEGVAASVKRTLPPNTDSAKAKEIITRANVDNAASAILEKASGVAERMRAGDLMIVQAIYDIGSGEVLWQPLRESSGGSLPPDLLPK
jgi:carbonic anhydrase